MLDAAKRLRNLYFSALIFVMLLLVVQGTAYLALTSYQVDARENLLLALLVSLSMLLIVSNWVLLPALRRLADQMDTRERQTREALRVSEERYRIISELTSDYFFELRFVSPQEMRVEWMSGAFARITGCDRQPLMRDATDWQTFVYPEDLAVVLRHFEKVLANQKDTFESRILRHDGQVIWGRVYAQPMWDEAHQRVTHAYYAVQDINERKKAEEALHASQRFVERVTQMMPGMVYVYDVEAQRPIYSNRTLAEFLGYSAEAFANNSVAVLGELVHPEDRPLQAGSFEQLLKAADGEMLQTELRFRHNDGKWRWLQNHSIVFARTADGAVKQLLGVVQDTTERKQAEIALREREGFIQQVIRTLPDLLYVYDLVEQRNPFLNRLADDTIVYIASNALGYSPEDIAALPGDLLEALVHPDHLPELARLNQRFKAARAGEVVENELRLRHKNGSWHWFNFRETVMLRAADDSPIQIVGLARGVTETRQAQELLRSNEARLRLTLEAARAGAWEWNMHSTRTVWSDENYRILGYEPGNVESTYANWLQAVHPDDRAAVDAAVSAALEQGSDLNIEFRVIWPDGSTYWVAGIGRITYDQQGQASGMIGILLDISARKRAEEALRESERLYRELFEGIEDTIIVHDAVGQILEFNEAAVRHLGYSREELLRLNIRDIYAPEQDDSYPTDFVQLWAVGSRSSLNDVHISKHGARIFVDLNARVVPFRGQQAILSVARDVTQRRQTEIALRENEERYRELFVASQRQAQELLLLDQVRSVVTREQGNARLIPAVLEALAQTFTYDKISLYLLEGDRLCLQHAVGFERVLAEIPLTQGISGRVARSGQAELVVDVKQDADYIPPVENVRSGIYVPLCDQEQVIGVLNLESSAWVLTQADLRLVNALSQQISIAIRRAQLYNELRDSEERFRQIAENINQVFWISSVPDGRLLYVNPAYDQIIGHSRSRLSGGVTDALTILHPEDRERVAAILSQQPLDYGFEARIVRPDGSLRWIMAHGYPVYNDAGVAYRQIGLVEDITERKRTEEQLRHQKDYLAALHETTLGLVARLDLNSLLEDILQRACTLLRTKHSYIYLMRDNPNEMECVVATGDFTTGFRIRLGEGLSGKVWASGQPLWVDHYNTWEGRSPALTRPMFDVIAAVPLKSGAQVVGVLGLAYAETGRVFDDEDIGLLTRFADLVSIALENARLYTLVQEELKERLRAEEALSQERALLRTLIDNVETPIFFKDASSRFVLVNPAVSNNFGVSAAELIGKMDFDFFPQQVAQQFYQQEQALMRSGVPLRQQEEFIIDYRGRKRWFITTKVPLYDREDKVMGLVGVSFDITERKRIEEAEREQRALAEAFRDTAAALSSTLDLDEVLDHILNNVRRVVPHDAANIMLVERSQLHIVRQHGYEDDFTEMARTRIFHVSELAGIRHMMATRQPLLIGDTWAFPDWRPVTPTQNMRSYLGVPIWLEEQVVGFINLNSTGTDFFDTVHSERLESFANQASIAIQNARLYTQAQELAMVEERQRLARELHDAVSQMLFSASLVAETLPRLWERYPAEVLEGLKELQRLTRGALAEMRNLLLELRPRALLDTDMSTLLKHLVDAVSGHTQIPVVVEVVGQGLLPEEQQLAFYRVAQEALNNIIKHARARHVTVKFVNQQQRIELTVQDDGRGFDVTQLPASQFGLKIMRERAQDIGAQLSVTSQPGAGSEIRLLWKASEGNQGGTGKDSDFDR